MSSARTKADVDAATAALDNTESKLEAEEKSSLLDLFGQFGQSIKALSRLNENVASLNEKRLVAANSTQRAAIDKELEAQKAEVERVTGSNQFGNAAAVLQDVSQRIQQGESRESIAATLGQHTELLGSGYFSLLQNAPAGVFTTLADGIADLGELTKNESLSNQDYSKKLDSILESITGALRGIPKSPNEEEAEEHTLETKPASESTASKPNFERLHVVA